jgi:hypothetical protein
MRFHILFSAIISLTSPTLQDTNLSSYVVCKISGAKVITAFACGVLAKVIQPRLALV